MAGTVESVTLEVEAPQEARLDLAPGTWILKASAEGYWVAPSTLDVAPPAVSESLELWPTGEVHAELSLDGNDEIPRELELRFRPALRGRPDPEGKTTCKQRDKVWACRAPATKLDLRFQSPGWVQQYRWDVEVPTAGTRHLGSLRFRRGAAVIGWVTTPGQDAVEKTRVRLIPRAAARQRDELDATRLERMESTAVTDRRGFFQIDGLPPGEYVLEALKEPYAPARVSVRVLPDRVTEVRDPPLVLREARDVEVFVDPALAPGGKRWWIRWTEIDRGSGAVASRQEDEVPEHGAVTLENMAPARYLLNLGVYGSDEPWYQEEVEVTESPSPLFLTLPVTEVVGTVSFGDEPLEGRLVFGRRHGAVSVTLESDSGGHFQGYLPRDGFWELDVEGDEPAVRRSYQQIEVVKTSGKSYAELDLRIPDTRLEGVVVDEADRLVRNAIVTAQSLDEIVAATRVETDAEGGFEVLGLPAGRSSVIAEGARGEVQLYSQEVEVDLEDDGTPARVRLVLRPESRIRGRVVDGDRGVPGAKIKAEPVQLQGLPLFPEVSDAEGFFEVHIPSQTLEIVLSVGAPGYAFRFFRLPVSVEELLVVPVTQAGGTLAIRLPEDLDRTLWNVPDVYLHHGGASESLGYLLGWARLNDQIQVEGEPVVLPGMEPGDYVACLSTFDRRFEAAGSSNEDGRCAGGQLLASGSLELSLD